MAEWTQHIFGPLHPWLSSTFKDEDSCREETWNWSCVSQAVTQGTSTHLAAIVRATTGQEEANLVQSHLCHTAWADCPRSLCRHFGAVRESFNSPGWTHTVQRQYLLLAALINRGIHTQTERLNTQGKASKHSIPSSFFQTWLDFRIVSWKLQAVYLAVTERDLQEFR